MGDCPETGVVTIMSDTTIGKAATDTAATAAATDDATGDPNGSAEGTEGTPTTDERLETLTAELEALKGHSRTWETRAKANKSKADELDRLKVAEATPDQRLAVLEARAVKAETDLLRRTVAAAEGLPNDLADLLTGADEDEMTAQAKRLSARLAPVTPVTPAKPAPKPDPSQGSTGSGKPSARDEGRAEALRRFGKTN